MTSYDQNGRLRIALTSTGSGGGGGSLTLRASGTLGSVSASSVSTLTFSGSFLTASNATSGEVIVSYFNNPPIMYLTGFQNSTTTPANHNFYIVTSSGFFSGSENFMCSVLYSSPWPPDFSILLAGNAGGASPGASDWKLMAYGTDFYSDDSVDAIIGASTQPLAPGLSPFGKWHIAYMYYSVADSNTVRLYLDSAGQFSTYTAAVPTWNTAVSFSIGAYANGFGADASYATRIAAVALATGSYVSDPETLYRYFQQVYRDGDIRQNGIMNWNHIWSVKQNTPGSSWRDAVGSFHLTRSGSLAVSTESNPRWS